MVLHRRRCLRFCSVSYIRSEGLEANVNITYPTTSNIAVICSTRRHLIPNLLGVRFFFDYSLTYVGAGMICSHLVNISTLLGAILSWGILWPLISKQKGEWYPANIPLSSMKSLYGYKASPFSYHQTLLFFVLGYYTFKKQEYLRPCVTEHVKKTYLPGLPLHSSDHGRRYLPLP